MIDTHCHVHDRAFDADRDEVIARARAAGVSAMVTVGEDVEDSIRAIETAQRYELAAAAGIHPHQARNAPGDVASSLRPLLNLPGVVAIGETGLDYYYEHSPRERQAQVLRAQLRLARETALPVVFHQRDAFEDFVAILREEWHAGMRGVVHCFTGTADQARVYVGEFGLFLGIGGVLTFPKAQPLRDAVRAAGAATLVLETDCPYLAPVPLRGKRNEPSFVTHTAIKLAEVLAMPRDELAAITDENALTLFRT
ncbi:MAG TPA: TatD family hydrolase [Candidatus Babeliales bacterium]|nr:TatD family hydrolase [Candidatus Babeliales bacterium]